MKKLLLTALIAIAFSACENKNQDTLIVIHTKYGDMKAILYDETPLHKKNFIELAEAGRYDSTTWYRVVKDFMIQGGDIQKKEGIRETEADRIPAEIVDGFYHVKGAMAAARQPDSANPERMSSSSQFYIVDGREFTELELTTDQVILNQSISKMLQDDQYDSLRQLFIELQRSRDAVGMNQLALDSRAYVEQEMGVSLAKEDVDMEMVARYKGIEGYPFLDGEYTVFGRVVEGLDVIDKIAAQKTRGEMAVEPAYLTIELEQISKKEVTKLYGYEYPKEAK